MTRKYEPKRPQSGAVYVTDDGLPPASLAGIWKEHGPTSDRNTRRNLRELMAFVTAFEDFRAQGIEFPTNTIRDEHLWNPYFIEALRIAGAFAVLRQLPPVICWMKNPNGDRSNDDDDRPVSEINMAWSIYFSNGGVVDYVDRGRLRDRVRRYMRDAESFMHEKNKQKTGATDTRG